MTHFCRPAFLLLSCSLLLSTGCDERTPEEKGRDYADEKLGFVEGAADQLSKRGKDIGSSLGKGVGDLVKGTGSAVKDVVHPPVTVALSSNCKKLGINIGQATEGSDAADNREVVIHLQSEKPHSGPLSLAARHGGQSVAVAVAETQNLMPGKSAVLRFHFDNSVRLSKMDDFLLDLEEGKGLSVDQSVASLGISFKQLSEKNSDQNFEVSVYAIFDSPFRQGLSLRAYDARGDEIGRSTKGTARVQSADSASYLSFSFDPRTPHSQIAAYKIYLDKSPLPAP